MNRHRFLTTGLTAASAAICPLRLGGASGADPMKPRHRYLSDASVLSAGEIIRGPARVLDLDSRKGINPTSTLKATS